MNMHNRFTLTGLSLAIGIALTSQATAVTRSTSYTYDSSTSQIATMDGPRTDVNDVTAFTYNTTNGNLTKITDALGYETSFTSHDASGRPQMITDPNGSVTTLTYHPRGWLTSRTVDGHITTFDYDNVGQLTKLTLPTGAYINYTYDAAHRLTDITDNLGNTIHYTLDAMGNRTMEATKDSGGNVKRVLEREYDELSQLFLMISGEGNITRYAYDQNGNQTAMTDPRNTGTNRNTAKTLNPLQTDNTSQSLYDALNRLVEVVHLQSANNSNDDVITTYEYNALDQLTKVIDPNGLETIYTYNALGDLEQLQSPDTGVTTYTYDDAGNRITQTDARNVTTTYTYDALNRLTSVSYPDNSLNVTYIYDQNGSGQNGIGRLTTMQDASGQTQYVYDKRGNTTAKVITVDGLTSIFQYAYNGADQITQITYPSGTQINYVYDAAGRVNSVTLDDGTSTRTLADNLDYAPFGPITAMDFGNNIAMTRQYDQDYRLISNTQGNIINTSYQYDAASNIDAITDNLNSSTNQLFNYDGLSRLTYAQGIYGTQSYDYDATGNRTLITYGASTQNYNYPANSHHLDNIDNAEYFSYDANGNSTDLPHLGLGSLNYNDQNRLSDISGVTYTYNGNGERVKKDNGNTTYYDFGLNGELLAERDDSGTILNEYVYVNGQFLATTTPSQNDSGNDIRTAEWEVAGMGDFDGDGVSDVFWRNMTNGQNYLYLMTNGSTIKLEGLLNTVGLLWQIAGVGDFDGDGKDDIFWRNTNNGDNYVYLMNGLSIKLNAKVDTVADQNWQVAGIGDLNGNGKDDILWRHATSTQNWIYLMNGKNIAQSAALNTAAAVWKVQGLGDFNGDGKEDILWRHNTSGQVWMYQMNGIGIQSQQAVTTESDLNWKIVGVDDLGGDGKADIVWRHTGDGKNWLYQMNGFSITQNQLINTVSDQNWTIAGTGRLNSDNKADLFWRHASLGNSNAYYMNGKSITQSVYVWRDSYIEGNRYYVHTDHLGTPQSLTDANQTTVWDADYEPFGQALINNQTITNNVRFPGQYFDDETGLHYNYFRTYDPSLGRYITSDPIGLGGGINTFAYVESNPIIGIDFDGLNAIFLPKPIVLPRPVVQPRPIKMPAESIDPAAPIPDVYDTPLTPKDPNGEYCKSLARRIENTKKEIYNKRYPDLDSNPGDLPNRIGPGEKLSETVRGHEKLLNRRLRELRNLEDEYYEQCVPMACL